jgi:hypothetical protein
MNTISTVQSSLFGKKFFHRLFNSVAALVIFLGILSLPASAQLSFSFQQKGFTGGGVINGSFTAVDLNNDGSIYAAPWGSPLTGLEVTQFSFSFTGDALVPDFTSTSLGVLGFELNGDSLLGNSPSEGIANNWFGVDGFIYAAGQGPANSNGGVVIDLTSGEESATEQVVTVSPQDVSGAVPEPSTYGVLGAVALATLAFVRRCQRTIRHQSTLVTITSSPI